MLLITGLGFFAPKIKYNKFEIDAVLKVIYHLLYSMNNFVTNKPKLPQDGAQVFPYMG